MKRKPILLTAIALGLLVTTGCDEDGPMDFNNTLVLAQRRIARDAKQFRTTITPLYKVPPEEPNIQNMETAYQKIQETLVSVQTRVQQEKLPPQKSSGKYQQAYLDYLQKQKQLLDRYYPEIIRLAGTPMKAEDKRQAIDATFQALYKAELTDLRDLKKAQFEFAEECRFKLFLDRDKDKGKK